MAVLTGSVPVAAVRDYQKEVTAYTKGREDYFVRSRAMFPAKIRKKSSIGLDMIRRGIWRTPQALCSAPMGQGLL